MSESHETNGCVSPFLEDGYSAEYLIPAQPGRWPDVRVRYRPLSADEESVIFAKKNLNPAEPIVRFYAEAFAGSVKDGVPPKLIGWDLKDRSGNPVLITAANLRRLTPHFFDALKAIIDGTAANVEADVKNS